MAQILIPVSGPILDRFSENKITEYIKLLTQLNNYHTIVGNLPQYLCCPIVYIDNIIEYNCVNIGMFLFFFFFFSAITNELEALKIYCVIVALLGVATGHVTWTSSGGEGLSYWSPWRGTAFTFVLKPQTKHSLI